MATHGKKPAKASDSIAGVRQVVEVVYALPGEQSLVRLSLPATGMTAAEAIRASGLRGKYPEIDRDDLPTGVFGKPCAPTQSLKAGDRVEIYRPLRNDPRAMRRARAAQGAGSQAGQGAKTRASKP
jgi:uncharacterized protein